MSVPALTTLVPAPNVICEQIRALKSELVLARRLLRISVRAHRPRASGAATTHRRAVPS